VGQISTEFNIYDFNNLFTTLIARNNYAFLDRYGKAWDSSIWSGHTAVMTLPHFYTLRQTLRAILWSRVQRAERRLRTRCCGWHRQVTR